MLSPAVEMSREKGAKRLFFLVVALILLIRQVTENRRDGVLQRKPRHCGVPLRRIVLLPRHWRGDSYPCRPPACICGEPSAARTAFEAHSQSTLAPYLQQAKNAGLRSAAQPHRALN